MKKQTINKIFFILLALVLCLDVLSLGTLSAFAAETSGTCGENVQWSFKNGELTISGKGAMENYSKNIPAPWQALRQQIFSVVIQSGVTNIGDQAFYDCSSLVSVTMADSVAQINQNAFLNCVNLTHVKLSGTLNGIGESAFEGCTSLIAIRLPRYLSRLGSRAFYRCESLGGITIPASVTELGAMVFGYCYRLSTAKIEAPIKSLPYWFFYGCINLTDVFLPNTVINIEENALAECPKLYYVQCDNKKAQAQIQKALQEPTALGEEGNRDIEYVETNNATIVVDTYFPKDTTENPPERVIDAVVENEKGVTEVVEYVNNSLSTIDTVVNIQVQTGEAVNAETFTPLVGKDVTVQIQTNENSNWQLNMNHQTEQTLQEGQELFVEIAPHQPTQEQKEAIGDADSFILKLGKTDWNTTVFIPVGTDSARSTASLYRVESNQKLTLLQSVIIDDAGKAAFALAGTSAGDYVLALNVENINKDAVRIPAALYKDYGIDPEYTLMGMDGRYYTITGHSSSLGIDIGQMTLIIIAVLVVTAVTIGGVMFVINKQKIRKGYVPDFDENED